MKTSEVVGKNIQKCLNENGMNVKQYAKLIGVVRQTASNYIDGISSIDVEKLSITAEYFNRPINWFFEDVHIPLNLVAKKTPRNSNNSIEYELALREIMLETLSITTKIQKVFKNRGVK